MKTHGQPNEQLFPKRLPLSNLNRTKSIMYKYKAKSPHSLKENKYSFSSALQCKIEHLMHQSFVATAPSGPGISEAFNFSILKAPLKALHSGAKIVVKSLLKAPPSRELTIMTNNKWPESFELTFLAYPIVIPHKLWLHWSCSFREKLNTYTGTYILSLGSLRS